MKFKQQIAAAAGILALVAGTLMAQTQGKHHARGQFGERRMEMMATALNMTDDQKAVAKAAFDEARTASQPIAAQLKQGHEAVQSAIKAGKSPDEVAQIAASQGNWMGQLAAVHAKALAKVYAVLTPEQREKADTLHQNMRGMMQQRWRSHSKTQNQGE